MIEPRVGIRQFATSVVRAAMARGDDAQGVTARLYESLANLVGPAGFDVLLARSLVLARRANPFLDNVVAGPRGTLTGLEEAAKSGPIEPGLVEVVSYFMELLAVLIGEDLAMHLARDAWPEGSGAVARAEAADIGVVGHEEEKE
jgi:hypothetical protein